MRSLLLLLALSAPVLAQEPPQAPPVIKSEEPPQAPPVTTTAVRGEESQGYKDAVAAVAAGQRIRLYTGVAAPKGHRYACPKLDSFAAGVYDCYLLGSLPCFERVEVPAPVTFRQPVFKPATFSSGIPFHGSHTCPVCKRDQFVIDRVLPSGKHVHVCSAGHAWQH